MTEEQAGRIVMFRTAVMGICFTAGLCLAGSEGDWWPWLNIAGLAIFAMVPVLARGEAQNTED